MNNEDILNLEPLLLWKYFNEISKIPHCSEQEEQISNFINETAIRLGYKTEIDEVYNILVTVPASSGYENREPICLQAHVDMVCEKNSDIKFDFSKDPIKLYIDGDWVSAQDTTLGADNGIGVAAMLALLEEQPFSHPPLELLFTIGEEIGLVGAIALKDDFLKAKKLINLDGESEGSVCIGCAGGGDTEFIFSLKKTLASGEGLYIKIRGLKGGHSGVDIHLGRGNAIKFLARLLYNLQETETFELSSINGGNKRNAIPREAEAIITVINRENAKNILNRAFNEIKNEFEGKEDQLALEIKETSVSTVFEDGEKVIRCLMALPHGVFAMNAVLENLVDSSTNLAVIHSNENAIEIYHKTRSSIQSALNHIRRVLENIGNLSEAKVIQKSGYPAWQPNFNSPLLKQAKNIYRDMYNAELKPIAVHGGLEPAIFGEKFLGMDMISIGAKTKYPHSPDEKVKILSVQNFYTYLKGLLEHI